MFQKNLNIAYLLDFYGEILSDRKRQVLDSYYNNDLSLSEIAAELGISRQGVRELIKKAEEELEFYESKLRLAQRFRDSASHVSALRALMERYPLPDDVLREIRALEETLT